MILSLEYTKIFRKEFLVVPRLQFVFLLQAGSRLRLWPVARGAGPSGLRVAGGQAGPRARTDGRMRAQEHVTDSCSVGVDQGNSDSRPSETNMLIRSSLYAGA